MAGISVSSITASPSVFTKGQTVQFTVVCVVTMPTGATNKRMIITIKAGDTTIATYNTANVSVGTNTVSFSREITAEFGGSSQYKQHIGAELTLNYSAAGTPMRYTCTGTSQDAYAARLNPSVSIALSAKRASGGSVNDEGTDLCITAEILSGTGGTTTAREALGVTETVRLYYAEERAATTDDSYITLTPTALNSNKALNASNSFVSGCGLAAAYNYGLLLVYSVTAQGSTETQTCQSATTISRAFANVHLSGAMTDGKQVGGVAFGKFSSVANGDETGKFECAYPAYFENGVYDGDGNQIGGIGSREIVEVVPTDFSLPAATVKEFATYTVPKTGTYWVRWTVDYGASAPNSATCRLLTRVTIVKNGVEAPGLEDDRSSCNNARANVNDFLKLEAGWVLSCRAYKSASGAITLGTGTKLRVLEM